jgi:hypothetical protein
MSLVELRSSSPAVTPARPHRATSAAVAVRGPRGGGTPWRTLAAIAVVGGCGLAVLVGTVLLNGDGVWHLLWGRSLADGSLDSFAKGPTPHPSLLVLGAATSLLGDEASYSITYVLFGPLAFGWLLAAVYEVARRLASRWAAVVAVLIVATSLGVLSAAGAARYDIAFAALAMTAVALELARPRRGTAPLACLAVAGLIRPEAWLLAGAYWLWLAPRLSWGARARMAALVAVAPLLWALMDLLVMGDPLYSLHATDAGSDRLYRQYTPWDNLGAAARDLVWYLGAIPILALAPAAILLVRDGARRALPLLCMLGVTLGVFLLLVSQGMASNERYLLVPVCVLAVLAAMAVDGGGRRTPRRVVIGVFLATLLCFQVATRIDAYERIRTDAASGETRYESARELVRRPGVGEALRRCPEVALAGGGMFHWFALYAGRAPAAFISDGEGHTRPDVYVAPVNAEVAEDVLTRRRFDDDASFRVPPGLRPGPRNALWAIHFSPASACTSGLR